MPADCKILRGKIVTVCIVWSIIRILLIVVGVIQVLMAGVASHDAKQENVAYCSGTVILGICKAHDHLKNQSVIDNCK